MQVYYSKRSFRLHSSQQSLPRKNGASCISFSLSLLSLSLYHHFQEPRLIHCLGPSPEQNIFSWTCCHEEKGFVQWSNPKIRRKVQMDMGIYICTPLFQTNPSLILKKNVLGQLPVCFFTQNRHHCFQAAHDILAAQVEEIWAAASGCKTQGIWRIINAVEHHWHRTYGIDQLGHITVYWKTYLKTPLSLWTTIFKYI